MKYSYEYLANITLAFGLGLMYPASSICCKAIEGIDISKAIFFVAFLSWIIGVIVIMASFLYLHYQESTSSPAR